MNVAFVTSWLSAAGGGGISAAVEATSHALHRAPVSVAVLGLADRAWQPNRWRGAPVHGFPTRGPRALGWSPGLSGALRSLAPDIVHSHGLWTHTSADVADWASWGVQRRPRPYVVAPHGMLDPWALRHAALKKRIARYLYEDRHLTGAVCIHAVCQAEADAIRAFGLRHPICVIANGIALPESRPKPAPPWQGLFETGTDVLLFLGRVHPKKNVHGLLSAWAALKRRGGHTNWRLAIAGGGPAAYRHRLGRQVRELGLERDIAFLGTIFGDDKEAALRNAAAFVLPSMSEGLPVAILEAWSHALPVAMTPACNLGRGFAVGAAHAVRDDGASMARDLDTFLSLGGPALEEMGRRGHELVRQEFSLDGAAEQLTDVYRWLLGGGPRPDGVQ